MRKAMRSLPGTSSLQGIFFEAFVPFPGRGDAVHTAIRSKRSPCSLLSLNGSRNALKVLQALLVRQVRASIE